VLLAAVSVALADEVISEELKKSLIAQATAPFACGAGSIDLSSLTKPAGGSNVDYKCAGPCNDPRYDYYMNVCAPSTSSSDCQAQYHGAGICQYNSGTTTNVVASLGSWTAATWQSISGTQVQATLKDGTACWIEFQQVPRTAHVMFTCSGSTGSSFTVQEDQATCTFNLAINVACPGVSPDGGGMSGGLVFIIILLVVIPVYIVVGCIYKAKTKGTTGMESCPNIDFWRDLPGLVKDGFRFVFSKCRGGGSYSQV